MDLAQALEAVRDVDLFQGFTGLEELVGQCRQVALADREVLLEHGTVGSSMYVILDGQMEIYLGDRIIRSIGRGEYLGELALIESGKRSASARARGRATLLEVSQEQFERYVRARPEALLAIVRKISRRLRDSIGRAQAAYDHVNMMVHDLLNRVTILNSADLVKILIPADHEAQPFLNSILKASDEFTTMMRGSLLTFRGIVAPYGKAPERVDALVRECVEEDLSMHPDVRRAHVEIRAVLPLDPVRCNSIDIRRVVGNLVINAAQAVGEAARVLIGITQEVGVTVIEVTDNGPGIPEDIRGRIFEPRFTTKATGNGIGLSSCRHIIEVLHGGRLTFESAVGQGTTFRCELPG